MIYELKIQKKKESPFTGTDGQTINYFWYNAEVVKSGLGIRFGSINDGYNEGDVVNVDLIKEEKIDAKGGTTYLYKEIVG